MAQVQYMQVNGALQVVDIKPGKSVMDGATKNGIRGIVAECGGSCSCGTCHVYVDPQWVDRVGPPSPLEQETLHCSVDVRENSRLSCQIRVTDALNGLIVHIPESQY